jgi:hypothetical protein
MAFVEINPRYRDLLKRQGLVAPDHFLALPAVIVSGHPDRNAARVTVGEGPSAVGAFLKREHRVRWRGRLANAWAGFGFVSQSFREYLTLKALREAGIACPDALAAGEDGRGQAFLLVREVTGARDLRCYLRERRSAPPEGRRAFARKLGRQLARVHAASFIHPDLYSKHVLVGREGSISFLDWQRSRRRPRLGWRRRLRELAALDATLADDLATPRERLACLSAYLRAGDGVPSLPLALAARVVRRYAAGLRQRRRVRELLHPPLAVGAQALLRLDGEALCVTPTFYAAVNGQVPGWLTSAPRPERSGAHVVQTQVTLPDSRRATLVRRRDSRPLRRLWSWLRRRPPASPEREQAVILFRLQRLGVVAPPLLAVGQRHPRLCQVESFLLTETLPENMALAQWLSAATGPRRRQVIREVAAVLRRLHDANCTVASSQFRLGELLRVRNRPEGSLDVAVEHVAGLRRSRRSSPRWIRDNLAAMGHVLTSSGCTRTDRLRFLLSYLGSPRLTPAAKRIHFAVFGSRFSRAREEGRE